MLYSTNTSVVTERVGLERGIDLLIDAGFPALDLTFGDYSYAIGEGALAYADKLKSYAASRGVVFNQAHAPFGGYDVYMQKHLPAMPEIIEFAATLGAKNIIVHPIMKGRHYGFEEEHFRMNIDFYSSLARYARSAGIKIAVENMWCTHPVTKRIEGSVCASPEEFIRYYDALDPEVFTLCVDVGHVALTGREPEDVIRALGGERIGAIHAHDVDYANDLHTLPGTAKIKWYEVARALGEIDYKGEFTLEADGFFNGFDKEYFPVAAKFMADTARHFASKIDEARP